MHITVVGFGPVEKQITEILAKGGIAGYSVVAPENTYNFPHYYSMDDFKQDNADGFKYAHKQGDPRICIDFSNKLGINKNIEFYAYNKINAVVGTKGLTEVDIINIQRIVKESGIAVIYSNNFSITEQMFIAANKIMAAIGAGSNIDVMLKERFNGDKSKISPLGRKLTSDIIKTANFGKNNFFLHPKQVSDETAIRVYSDNTYQPLPEHEIKYEKENNTIELIHTGTTPDIVALGAIDAAKRINRLKPDFYDYNQLILNEAMCKLRTKKL